MKKTICLYVLTAFLVVSNLISFYFTTNNRKTIQIDPSYNNLTQIEEDLPGGYYPLHNFNSSNSFTLNENHIKFDFESSAKAEIDNIKIYSENNNFIGGEILPTTTIDNFGFFEMIRINNVIDEYIYIDLLETTRILISVPMVTFPYDFNLFEYKCFLNGSEKNITKITRMLNFETGNFDLVLYIQNNGDIYSGIDIDYKIKCCTFYKSGYHVPLNYIDYSDDNAYLRRIVYYSQKPYFKLEQIKVEEIYGLFAKVTGDWIKPSFRIALPL